MDFIRPIGSESDVDPVVRVQRLKDEREKREREARERQQPRRQQPEQPPQAPEAPAEGPVEGDDGHLHIDIRA